MRKPSLFQYIQEAAIIAGVRAVRLDLLMWLGRNDYSLPEQLQSASSAQKSSALFTNQFTQSSKESTLPTLHRNDVSEVNRNEAEVPAQLKSKIAKSRSILVRVLGSLKTENGNPKKSLALSLGLTNRWLRKIASRRLATSQRMQKELLLHHAGNRFHSSAPA